MNRDEVAAGMAETPGYRYAERVGDELVVAGQVPHVPSGALIGAGDARAQAVACLDNLATLIDVHGFHLAEVRHLTVYVVGSQQNLTDAWSAVTGWFDESVPPATLLGVHLLGHHGQLVEVDARIVRHNR